MALRKKAISDDPATHRPSPRLRAVLSAIERDLDGLTHEVIANLRKEIPVYGAIADETRMAELFANVRENIAIVFESFLQGHDVPSERFAEPLRVIRKRASQNVPLEALLRAYRISCPLVWAPILGAARNDSSLRDEILFKLTPRAFSHFDLFTRVVQQAYVAEVKNRFREHDRAKEELSRLVLGGTADEPSLRADAAALGLDPAGLYSAIVFELRRSEGDPLFPSNGVTQLLNGFVSALGANPESVVETLAAGTLIAWILHPSARLAAKATEDLVAACRDLFDEESVALRAGVSTAVRGIGNWKIAYEQARKALEMGKTLDPTLHVHRYTSVAVRDIVSRTPEVTGFLQALLDLLSGDEELLRSAEAYFATGRHPKSTAADLGVHRNTLTYRLRRIEQLLGGSFDDPGLVAPPPAGAQAAPAALGSLCTEIP